MDNQRKRKIIETLVNDFKIKKSKFLEENQFDKDSQLKLEEKWKKTVEKFNLLCKLLS